MAEHVHTPTSTPSATGPGRRRLARAAGLFALIGASAAAGPDDNLRERLATLEDYATAEFKAWPPGSAKRLGTGERWLVRANHDFNVMKLAIAALEKDHHASAKVAAECPEALLFEFLKGMQEVEERHQELVTTLKAAQHRVIAGMARHAVATGEA